jgi:hypothetical protein
VCSGSVAELLAYEEEEEEDGLADPDVPAAGAAAPGAKAAANKNAGQSRKQKRYELLVSCQP